MNYLTKSYFINKIYKTKLEPELRVIEKECQKYQRYNRLNRIIAALFFCLAMFIAIISNGQNILYFIFVIISILPLSLITINNTKVTNLLKNKIVSKILNLFGNLYFNESNSNISLHTIQESGLYCEATRKNDDDIVAGYVDNINFIIDECTLTHVEHDKERSRTVTDFDGLIVKFQMNKNFTGTTIIGEKQDITRIGRCEKVVLESEEFMKGRNIFSTNQIEARYLITPAFMERLIKLETSFDMDENKYNELKKSNNILKKFEASLMERKVAVVFKEGYIYLFIPKYTNFFDIPLTGDILNPELYYSIYIQIQSILDIIDLFKLNQKIGL